MHSPWDPVQFQRILRRIMDGAGLSQPDIARLAGMSRPQVSRWLSGAHRPGFDALQQLAGELHQAHPALDETVRELLLAAGYEGHPLPGAPPQAAPSGRAVTPTAPEPRFADPRLQYVMDTPGLDLETRLLLVDLARAVIARGEEHNRPA